MTRSDVGWYALALLLDERLSTVECVLSTHVCPDPEVGDAT